MTHILGIDHVSVLVKNADRSRDFYQAVLGLKVLDRPNLGFPGYWLDLGSRQSIHLMELPNPCEGVVRPEHGGRDAHFALRVESIVSIKMALTQKGIVFSESKSGRKALFIKDLDNNAFELFELSI